MKKCPPDLAKKLLECSLTREDRLHRLGDFEEVFHQLHESQSRRKAIQWYWIQVLKSIPHLLGHSFCFGGVMLKNYLKIALRVIGKNRIYSLINIAGVAVSLAACFLILQYVGFETSFDRFHENAGQIYRLTNDRFQDGKLIQHGVITYPSVAKTMKTDFPEVVNFTRVIPYNQFNLQRDDVRFEETLLFADSAFFSMFSFELMAGDAHDVLARPYSIALSESQAAKYFGSDWRETGILGRTLTADNSFDLTVTGVFRDVPENSHMKFNLVVSWLTLRSQYGEQMDDSWTNSNFMGYLELAPGTDPAALESKFPSFSERYFRGDEVTGHGEAFFIQPLADIHLKSDYEYESWVHGSQTAVNALLLIAGFILLITWMNFINLSTARGMERCREVGLRKVLGARKGQIVRQFFTEAALINGIGLLLAAGLASMLMPLFSELLGVPFKIIFLKNTLSLFFLLLFLAGTVLSGIYPAMVASSIQTATALKGKLLKVGLGRRMRMGLVVFQFALSFVLIAGTYVVYRQIGYMMKKDLGMNIDQMMVVGGPYLTPWSDAFYDDLGTFKSELHQYPAIKGVASSQRIPGLRTGRLFNVSRVDGASEERFTTADIGVDYNYFEIFEMTFLAGRGFSRTDHHFDFSQVTSIVINESTVKLLGFESPEAAVGQGIGFWGRNWTVIGVVADHHQQSPHVPVEPVIFTPQYGTSSSFFVKVETANLAETVQLVQQKYEALFPDNNFTYFFLDEFFNRQYQSDQTFGRAFSLFASLGVVLACMGLFGLSFFTIAQRTKEIGIRKVVGASTATILGLLFREFALLIGVSVALAAPAAVLVFNRWLEGYAYHLSMTPAMLLIPSLAVLAVALGTVSFQAVKVAFMNPVDSIKYE